MSLPGSPLLALSLLASIWAVPASAFPRIAMAKATPQVYTATLDPRPLVPMMRAGPIFLVGSQAITGTVTLSVTSTRIFATLVAGGSYPAQGTATAQVFNPLVNTRTGVSLFHSIDGGKTWQFALPLQGAWKPLLKGKHQFQGTTNPDLAFSKLNILRNPSSFAVVLTAPPFPHLADFVYVSMGKLKKLG